MAENSRGRAKHTCPKPGAVHRGRRLPQSKTRGEAENPGIRQAAPTRPTAACRATLTFMENLRPNIPTASRPAGKEPPGPQTQAGVQADLNDQVADAGAAGAPGAAGGGVATGAFVGGVHAGAYDPNTEVLLSLPGRFESSLPLYQAKATSKITTSVM